MSDTPCPDRDQEILSDLAERAYALACKVQDQAMASEEPETISRLTGDFDRAARCVRQTIGLKAKLKRDAERQDRDDQAEAARDAEGEITTRRAQVGATVRRVIGEQYRGYDARELREDLEARLDEEALYDGFTEESVDDHIERVCDELGLAKPGETPPPRPSTLSPERQARLDEILASLPADDEDDDDDEAETPIADDTEDDGVQAALPVEPEHAEVEAQPVPSAAEPEPPPRPPDPEPYLMPWERGPPGRRPPGGSWMA